MGRIGTQDGHTVTGRATASGRIDSLEGLRVLHVTDSLNTGGLERVVVDLVAMLVQRGARVGMAAAPGGDMWAELPAGVERCPAVPEHGTGATIAFVLSLRRALRAGGWQVLHAHQRRVALLCRVAALGTGTRVVEHVHNVFEEPAGLRRALSFRGHHLIACGSAVRDMLVRDFGRPRHRVTVVKNAVADLGAGTDLTIPFSAGGLPKIVGIGRLVPQKDPVRFVEAIRALNRHEQRVSAEWVGGGEMFDELTEDLARDPVPGLRMSGPSRDVAAKIRGADLLLISSRWEGLPLVALESLALGRGVVSSDVGSCRDVVHHGLNGALFPVDSSAEQVAAVLKSCLDRENLERWGAQSRAIYVAGNRLEDMVVEVGDVYRRALLSKRVVHRGSENSPGNG